MIASVIAANLDIESITIHPCFVGIETIKTNKMKKMNTTHDPTQRFDVMTYTIEEDGVFEYCHWSDGLNMIIVKDGVTLTLNGEEIQQLVKCLPRTIGRTY